MSKYFSIASLLTLSLMVAFLCTAAQQNLLLNGTLSDFTFYDTSRLVNTESAIEIPHWTNNICQQYYNPDYSYTANSYIRLILFDKVGEKDYAIHNVQGQLCRPMQANKPYQITFYLKPLTGNAFCGGVCCWLTNQAINYPIYYEVQPSKSYKKLILPDKTYCDNRLFNVVDSFYKVSFMYMAKGGEEYFYVGNPTQRKPTVWKKTKDYGLNRTAFDYNEFCHFSVSNLSVMALDTIEGGCPVLLSAKSIQTDTSLSAVEVGAVYFPFNSDSLTAENKQYLQVLTQQITNDTMLQIQVTAYADTTGNSSYNYQLSVNRAKAVIRYMTLINPLVQKRININVVGETRQFGLAEKNRTVVLTITKR